MSTFLRDPWLHYVGRKAELAAVPVEVSFAEYLAVLTATRRNVFLFLRNKEREARSTKRVGRQAKRRHFFQVIGRDYSVPDGFQQDTHIFAMDGLATGHGMHRHKEAWLAQVAGRKMWWLAPPAPRDGGVQNSTGHPPFPYKDLSLEEGSWPCAWLLRRSLVPVAAPVFQCMQRPGDVLVLPAGWWHATCSLDYFNVAVGGQGG